MRSKKEPDRYNWIDYIRGLDLISMILYHAVWDLVYLCGFDWGWYRSGGAYLWQQSICWIFIFLSGFCLRLGKRRVKRGITVLAASALVSLVTGIFLPEEKILFGVLTLLGSCMLLFAALDPLLRKLPAAAGAAVSFGCFFLLRNVNKGNLGFEGLVIAALPRGLYRNLFTAYLGFPGKGFLSSDYFSLIPWIFLFAAGYFVFGILCRRRKLRLLSCRRENAVLSFLGRHSLILYLIHQPILYCLFIPMMPF